MDRRYIRYLLFSLASAFYVALAFTSADFLMMPFHTLRDVVIVGMQWAVLLVALSFLMLALASHRLLYALIFPPLVLLSSVLAYFRLTMNAVLTPMLLDVTFDNDLRTSADMITPVLILVVLTSTIIAILFARYRWKRIEVPRAAIPFLAGCALLCGMLQVDAFERPISERIPFNIYYTAEKYFEEKEALAEFVKDTMDNEKDSENTGIQVYIGNESPVKTMKDCSVVTATYDLGGGMQGTIGIIGPKRMDYENVMDNLKTLKNQLDNIFKKT